MQNKILIADIVPDANLPSGITQTFSYSVPKELEGKIKKGSVVRIPLRKKNIAGVVFGLREKSAVAEKYELKEITGLIDDRFELPPQLIELCEYASEYYRSPISLVIKTVLPDIVKNKSRKDVLLNVNSPIKDMPEAMFEKILAGLKAKNLLIHDLDSRRHSLYLKILNRLQQENGQALLLFPEYFDIYNFSSFYIKALGRENVSILTSGLTKNLYYHEWKKVMDGKAKLVIGTRQAVFAPFKKLDLIIIDGEHSSNYKQWDMNPRYNAINICNTLSSLWKAKLILSSPSPSVETFFRSKAGELETINITRASPEKRYEIIDMKTEREKKNFSVFSEKLKEELLKAVYDRKQAVIFLPKLGLNTVTKCKDCEYMAHCEDCSTLLSTFKDNLYCTHCKKKSELMKKCPKCGGQNISSFGYAIETVENEIKNIFSNKNIGISRLDSTVAENKSQQKKIYETFTKGKIDILIGTQMAIKNWNLENLSLIAILFPEIFFNQPDFRSRERSFQFLSGLKNETSPTSQVIIQTFNKENEAFASMEADDISIFYEKEIQFRKGVSKIGYPPFSSLIKLIYKNEDKDKCKKEASDLFEIIYKKINSSENLRDSFEIIRPYPAQNFKEYGKFRYYIVIKCSTQNIALRNIVLSEVKKDWIIDIDPDSLL